MRINYLMSPNGLNTFTTCVSRITFLSTSSVEPAPRSPLCPGLSTRISDAIVIGLPLIPTSNVCCSTFQTLYTAGITYPAWRLDNSRLLKHMIFMDSINLSVLFESIPVPKILDAISKFRAGKRFSRGAVGQDIL